LKPFDNFDPQLYSYALPEERIAMFPRENREDSLLLIRRKDGSLSRDTFRNLATYLDTENPLVVNNSKVIPARLIFTKPTGSKIELFCLSPVLPSDYALSLSASTCCEWECMAGNLKRFNTSTLEMTLQVEAFTLVLKATKLHQSGNILRVRFSWENQKVTFGDILAAIGRVPLPPYIKRQPVEKDLDWYQTIYSKHRGSVAAPTAGLHFTPHVFGEIALKKIPVHEVTLHVGAGTFQPVKTNSLVQHTMHSEYIRVSGDFIRYLAELGKKVTAVGTTSVRTLETLYWLGVKLLHDGEKFSSGELNLEQWEAYTLPQQASVNDAMSALAHWLERSNLQELIAYTRLLIIPGYEFRVVRSIITNFHQPGSTLLLLVAAFVGESWKETYQYALDNGFRFLSYGDSSLLL
jgi:S-adenosylmethionine:tRNA ribosyltransferase-isomerase